MKLNQVLAKENNVKKRVHEEKTYYHHNLKPATMNGVDRTYLPKTEADEQLPPERQKVQFKYVDVLSTLNNSLNDLFDITASKDYTNCSALADIVVNGETLLKQVPTTFLLFLEKELKDLETFVAKMPELDDSESNWTFNEQTNTFHSTESFRQTTKKLQRAIVLYDATKEHPAQTQLITEDVVVGQWRNVKLSGAMPANEKRAFLKRVETLLVATKCAREEANTRDAMTVNTSPLVKYLFQR